jgi:hypothetical protein
MLVSIGDQVRPGNYRLHSRFNRAVNFERAGRLVSVVDETIGPGPLNIVLGALPAGAQPLGCRNPRNPGALRQAPERSPLLQPEGCAPPALAVDGLTGTLLPQVAADVSRRIFSAAEIAPTDVGGYAGLVNHAPPEISGPTERLPLRITTCTLMYGGHRYPFTSRHRYNSTLELSAVDPNRFRRNLSALGDALLEDAPPKSVAFLLDSNRRKNFRRGFERAFADQIGRGVNQVFNGKLLAGVRQLKGCGFGLTPAGDDFIAGLLLGLHLLQRLRGQNLQPRMDAICRAAQGDNLFSNTFLDLARRGLLFGRMKDLLVAVTSGSRSSVRRAAEALFAVGETSGADLATGLFLTLRGNIANGPQK